MANQNEEVWDEGELCVARRSGQTIVLTMYAMPIHPDEHLAAEAVARGAFAPVLVKVVFTLAAARPGKATVRIRGPLFVKILRGELEPQGEDRAA